MRTRRGHTPEWSYSAGMRALARHDPASALPLLRTAVDATHPERRGDLARRLYWLAIALKRLGKDGLALKALASAQRVAPRSPARLLFCRASNEYGMPRSSCQEHDDYRAFFSVHARRYLTTVPGGRFTDQAEMETVMTVIADAWTRVGPGIVARYSECEDKLKAFRRVRIQFPVLGGKTWVSDRSKILAGDFSAASLIPTNGRCPCGSGLPASRCCNRVPLPYEL